MKKPGFKKVSILGMGLIGGSVGMAIRKKKLGKVIGVARRKESIRKATRIGAIDKGTTDIAEGVRNSDLVILAVPVSAISKIVKEAVPHLKPGCIITDVGSTKKGTVKKVDKFLPQNIFFVGSHPLAGSEKSGIEAARDTLFKNATCILTPGRRSSPVSISSIKNFWKALGMKVMIMSPEEHDSLLSLTSHLPHLAATSLVNLIADSSEKDKRITSLIASGFRDTTRIAGSSPLLWTDICMSNKSKIASSLKMYRGLLQKIEKYIRAGDSASLIKFLERARKVRRALNKS